VIRAADIARIEQWAESSYPDRGDEAAVVVHARGAHVNVTEERQEAGGKRVRSIVRFRYVAGLDMWAVHRLYGGGRWLEQKPADGTLPELLAAIDLARLPSP